MTVAESQHANGISKHPTSIAETQMSYPEQTAMAPVRVQTKDERIQEKKNNKDYLGLLPAEIGTDWNFKRKIVWKNAIGFLALHLAALYGFWVMVAYSDWLTMVWGK